ncbi:MAG: toll/interleukin-1 receptor domain-containing protein [Candidatus Izemoplasmatales bacterium]|nr:toll/interleukin-1 receptor domain-containing protein [Candidatus Izemoplasmatales bacterium]
MSTKLFISHRSTDIAFIDVIVDFLVSVGLPREMIFCSSSPGNDVKYQISSEIRNAIDSSQISIVFLSLNYYKSAYCLNESGILWYNEKPIIIIALPEISPQNMLGFLNDDYKIRRFDIKTDIAFVYDQLKELVENKPSQTTMTNEIEKTVKKFTRILESTIKDAKVEVETNDLMSSLTTDDEKLIIYYSTQMMKLKIVKDDLTNWLTNNELYDIDFENAFDLLTANDIGQNSKENFIFDIKSFKKISLLSKKENDDLINIFEKHQKLSSIKFEEEISNGHFSENDLLFVSYIIDKKEFVFGDRWMADAEIENIKEWEYINDLNNTLSSNYSECLNYFIKKRFVYESDWTSYGNPKEYKLHQSLRMYLLSDKFSHFDLLEEVKSKNTSYDLGF